MRPVSFSSATPACGPEMRTTAIAAGGRPEDSAKMVERSVMEQGWGPLRSALRAMRATCYGASMSTPPSTQPPTPSQTASPGPPGRARNRLAAETSPYLLQHQDNPVDWWPWGPEALAQAKRSNKPILLSVGYSACHWCHVMAHESFEDEPTARLMNSLFVNVKVDREERPDIDRIYQIAQQMITQKNGGWPLTMFLSHEDQRPFFGGTYFPKEPRYGMPAFTDILKRVGEYYSTHQVELRQQNEMFMQAFDELVPPAVEGQQVNADPLRACRDALARTFDSNYGGFGSAPK